MTACDQELAIQEGLSHTIRHCEDELYTLTMNLRSENQLCQKNARFRNGAGRLVCIGCIDEPKYPIWDDPGDRSTRRVVAILTSPPRVWCVVIFSTSSWPRPAREAFLGIGSVHPGAFRDGRVGGLVSHAPLVNGPLRGLR